MARPSKVRMAEEEVQESAPYALPETDTEIAIEATTIFYKTQGSKKTIVVNRGGAGSGKSHSIAQLLLYKFFNEQEKRILILRKTLPSLRISTLTLMNQLMNDYSLKDRIVEEKVHLNWYHNGSIIHYQGLDDPEKVKSAEFNYIWLEEATEFTWEEYQTIKLRLRAESKDKIPNQIFLSFNPIDERHWIKEKLVEDTTQDTKEIVSNYKDNPFLPAEYIKDLENLQLQDISFYNVYTLGNWGKLENIIYKNWTTCDWMPDVSAVDKVFYGLDFGYNDPSALIECRVKGKDVWERELLYHTKLTNSDLIKKLQELIPEEKRQKHYIFADSAEPDRIKEIKDAGFKIKPAIKLVSNGIDIVKRFNVHIMSESLNLIKEKRAYSWKKDRNGNVTDEPIGIWDHLMSAERYALHTGTKGGGTVRVRFI
jgi:phage terminase large subunit